MNRLVLGNWILDCTSDKLLDLLRCGARPSAEGHCDPDRNVGILPLWHAVVPKPTPYEDTDEQHPRYLWVLHEEPRALRDAMTLSGRQPCGMSRTLNGCIDFRDVGHEPQPNSRSHPAAHRRTMPESGRLQFATRTVHACKPLIFCFTASPSDTFKSEHPPVPRRPRLFLPERWVSKSPTFSSWQAAWFVSVPVSPLRRAFHRRSSRPAPAFPQSKRDLSLPTSSMTGKFGGDADWGSWARFAFCEVGWGERRPAKGLPRVPPNSATRGCCQARSTTGRRP